jgi:hypothetical protein
MWTNANGVNIYDVTTQTSSLVFPGVCNHIALYGGGGGALASAIPFGTGCDGLALVSAGTPQLGNAGFGLRVNNVPAASPVGLFGFGTLVVNPGVDLTIVGMPGCFAYTNLDLGLFTGSLVAGGSSTLPLPIPNTPALGGFTLSSQGVSFSTLTPLGLAASNGLTLVLGY